jgi:hypothetical protein
LVKASAPAKVNRDGKLQSVLPGHWYRKEGSALIFVTLGPDDV